MRPVTLLLLLVTVAHADVVDDIIAAHKAGKPLKEFAEKDEPDPWIVADDLCARGALDAADAFAKAAPRADVEGLPAYVAKQRKTADDAARRTRLAAANPALAASKFKEALDALGPPEVPVPDDVVGVRLACARGIALSALARLDEGSSAWLAAAEVAERIGWLARGASSYQEAGASAYRGSSLPAARAAWERRLTVSERRSDQAGAARALNNIGLVHWRLGQFTQALSVYERAQATADASGDKEIAATTLGNIGLVRASLGEFAEALSIYERALAAHEGLGNKAGAATTLGNIGIIHGRRGDYASALASFERALAALEALGDKAGAAATRRNIGSVHSLLGEHGEALRLFERARAEQEALGDKAGAAATLHNIGLIHARLGEYVQALATYDRVLAVQEALGDRAGASITLGNIGIVHSRLGDYAKALSFKERALALKEILGDKVGVAQSLGSIGVDHYHLADYAKALAILEGALARQNALGDRKEAAQTLSNLGLVYAALGDYSRSLLIQERVLAAQEALGFKPGIAETLVNIGDIHSQLGNYARALAIFDRALEAAEALGDRARIAQTRGSVGILRYRQGDYAQSLSIFERALAAQEALGDKVGQARVLLNIGLVYRALGDHAQALSILGSALTALEALGDKAGAAATLGNIGNVYKARGDHARALSFYERARAAHEALGNKAGVATALGNIGVVHLAAGDHARALAILESALAAKEAVGDKVGAARTLVNMGLAYAGLGDTARALSIHERARAAMETFGGKEDVATVLGNIASARAAQGDWTGAVEAARGGVDLLPLLVGGLGDQQAATARDEWTWLFGSGVRAAVKLDEPGELLFFLESGRAGSLLEALGNRERLSSFVIPPALRDAENEARDRERVALHLYRRALDKGDDVKDLWKEVEAARTGILAVVQRIQREAKAQADLVYPKAATLPEVQATLGDAEALVLYALLEKESFALIVTAKEARIVALGATDKITEAAEALQRAMARPDTRSLNLAPHEAFEYLAKRLRKLVVEPLGLKAKRVLISPDGLLCYVPFAVLTDAEVAYEPSATTYGLLRDDLKTRGKQVLALGNPDYAIERDTTELLLYAGGQLAPLPASGAEAQAVGDVVLLGKDATLDGLREALGKQERWHAVHLACHGLIDPQRPVLSSLALTKDFLRCLDVYRMKIPADLVVLSACETAKGKLYKTEGVIGWTRAFMFAGSPRVLVSLWKVDDEATRVLMEKFYEEWKGADAATALAAAQAHVRTIEKWKHPHFWAAWQLWGLPE